MFREFSSIWEIQVKTVLGSIWNFTVDAAKWVWEHKDFDLIAGFRTGIGTLWGWAVDAAKWVWEHRDFDFVAGFKAAIGTLWGWAVDGAKWLWNHRGFDVIAGFRTVLGSLWDATVATVKWLWNHKSFVVDIDFNVVGADLLERAKKLLDGIGIPGIGSSGPPGRDRAPLGPVSNPFQPVAPRQIFGQAHLGRVTSFATGGIVDKPTLALLGESGREAVVPLGSGGGMTKTVNFNFTGPITVQNESQLTELADQIFRQLETKLRRGLEFA